MINLNKIRELPDLSTKVEANKSQIKSAEEKLGLRFSDDFKEYVSNFGAIRFYATEWTGFNTDDYCDVVKTTLEARQLYDNFPKDMFILEDLHIDSLLILSDSQGRIYQWQNGNLEKIHNSIEDYLEECISRKE